MIRLLVTVPFAFAVAQAIPGVDGAGSISGLILQFGATGIVCWLAYYLVAVRMPAQEAERAQERKEAAERREERDKQTADERREDQARHEAAMQKLLADSAANREAFLASQCKYNQQAPKVQT